MLDDLSSRAPGWRLGLGVIIHGRIEHLEEPDYYAEHGARRASVAYQKAHHHLVVVLKLPCRMCGTFENLETHHCLIEWALTSAIDLGKFNSILLPYLREQRPDRASYQVEAFTQAEMEAWIDADEDNLWVLCAKCHRHKLYVIHNITYPHWRVANLLLDEFKTQVAMALAKTG